MRAKRQRKLFFWLMTGFGLLLAGWQIAMMAVSQTPSSRDVIINEFMAANRTSLIDESGEYADWIEIYNPNDQPINLAGWSLTDDAAQPEKWPFPDRTLGGRQYLLVFASGKDRRPVETTKPLHTNFRLKQEGEFLGLYNVYEDRFVEPFSGEFAQQFEDRAYGRYGADWQYGYLAHPTPGQPNDETKVWRGLVEPVQFSVERGFYKTPFTVTLTSPTPEAIIRYTLNGSQPSETNGAIYNEPIPVAGTTLLRAAAFHPDYLSSPVATHSYIFLDEVLTQPASPPGFPSTWGQHTIDFAGYKTGEPVAADYEVDPDIVADPYYKNQIKPALQTIPTLSIVTDVQSFYLYANPRKRGVAWERPASVELIYPDASQKGFQINAGIRIQGGAGRWEFMPKHSLRLFFKEMYGASKLDYPLFPNSPVTSFDTLVLRAGVDRSYAGHPDAADHRLATYTRDEWLRASQIAMSGVGSHGIFVHLYLNGLYWGLYNVVERPDESFASAYLGAPKEDWYVVNHRGSVSGSSERFQALLSLAEEGNLVDPARYRQVQDYLDVEQFADYLILNWYAGTKDWPENNWYAAVHNPEGRLNYFVWDGEESWNDGAEIHLGQDDLAGVPNTIKIIFEALIKNPDFRLTLADRMYHHLFHEGQLTDDTAQARWRAINAPLEQAIIGESLRWGDARYEPPITQQDWRVARDKVLAQMAGNGGRLVAQAQALGYYPPIEPPQFNQRGGEMAANFKLSLTAPGSTIYYTTDGTDPRLPESGAVSPTALLYEGPVVLTTTTRIKTRALRPGQGWSTLDEALFDTPTGPSQLQITEIMYHPPNGNDYEFIELKNSGASELSVAGASFKAGIRFTFPLNTPPLAAQQTIVLVANAAAFAEVYPETPISGVYEGQLSNKGETIRLASQTGEILAEVTYDDEQNWPISADGWGDSLVLVKPAVDPNDPASWRASTQLNGSPGVSEITP